jgi:hypothetical protein
MARNEGPRTPRWNAATRATVLGWVLVGSAMVLIVGPFL